MAEMPGIRELTFSRDWAGLTTQGRILISIERIADGHSLRSVLSHETAHDVLLKSSELGLAQLALSSEAFDPSPQGQLRDRCASLLELTIAASRFTHEGVATFAASVGLADDGLAAYRARHSQDYLDAASVLEWIRSRPFSDDEKVAIAFALGKLALGVPVLSEWETERLWGVESAQRWFSVPRNRPDRRFPALSRYLSTQPDEVVEAFASVHLQHALDFLEAVVLSGQSLSFEGVRDGRLASADVVRTTSIVYGTIIRHCSLPRQERERLVDVLQKPHLNFPGLAPTLMSVLLTSTTSTAGVTRRDPALRSLLKYPLVHVQNNAHPVDIPGITPVGRKAIPLQPGDSALWFSESHGGVEACHLSPGAMREWLEGLEDDTTICVRDGGYYLGLPIGEPRLKERRHVVLIQQRTPQQLLSEVSVVGLDPARSDVLFGVVESRYPEVAYVLLRPRWGSPMIVLPTAQVTANRFCDALVRGTEQVRFVPATSDNIFTTEASWVDLMRVIDSFESRLWTSEIMSRLTQRTHVEAHYAAADQRIEAVMGRLRTAWSNFEVDRTRDVQHKLPAAVRGILRSQDFRRFQGARRVDVLEIAGSTLHDASTLAADTASLSAAVEVLGQLLAELPTDWPVRFRYLKLAGMAMLQLSSQIGDAALMKEALALLRAAGEFGTD